MYNCSRKAHCDVGCMDRLERIGLEAAPKRGIGDAKSHGENVIKRKALTNATNMCITHAEGITDADGTSEETNRLETGVADTPKQVWMERNIHAALSENLSIPNMVQAGSSRKVVESVQQLRQTASRSLRRKRGQFDLYAQGVSTACCAFNSSVWDWSHLMQHETPTIARTPGN